MPPAPKLIGAYTAPAVRIGDRVDCLFRGCECVVTSIADAPIPWPRVQPAEQRGGCGLLVNHALGRAIRTESAVALKYHFGVSTDTVWRWRKCFGVGGHATTRGSRKAIRAAARLGAEAVKTKEWTEEELRAKAALALALGLRPGPRWTPERDGWTPEEVALLDQLTDAEIAAKTGRSVAAVRGKRRCLRLARG